MKVVWTERAVLDLEEIHEYIARDHHATAVRWVSKLQQRAEAAAEMPFAGRMVPEAGQKALREVLLKGYRIVYRVYEDKIEILMVVEGHRLLPTIDNDRKE
jgi:toxin ParE1/3/4